MNWSRPCLLVLLLLAPAALQAALPAFNLNFEVLPHVASLVSTSDGGLAVLGFGWGAGSPEKVGVSVVRLDAQGRKRWQRDLDVRTYDPEDRGPGLQTAGNLLQTPDGGFVFTAQGTHMWVITRLSASGVVTWQRKLPFKGFVQAGSVHLNADGSLLAAFPADAENRGFSVGKPDLWVLHLNAAGQTLSQRSLPGAGFKDLLAVGNNNHFRGLPSAFLVPQGRDILLVYQLFGFGFRVTTLAQDGTPKGSRDVLKLKERADLLLLGAGPTRDGGLAIQCTSSRNALGTGYSHAVFARLDASGQEIWSRGYMGRYLHLYPGGMAETPSGGYALIFGDGFGHFTFRLADSEGVVRMERTFDETEKHPCDISQLLARSDGSCVIGGAWTPMYGSDRAKRMWVFTLDAEGRNPALKELAPAKGRR
jgi:hypothetical protein